MNTKYCDGINRRDLLKVGALGGLGFGLPDLLRLEADDRVAEKGKSAILVFLTGGQSHIDTWDMKPDAKEVAGEFKPIQTNVNGLQVCELMPKLAQQADKYAVVRSVTHNQGAHSPGQRYLQTRKNSDSKRSTYLIMVP